MSNARLIVGLGNPGKKYEWTRHNLGFLIVSHVAREQGLKFSKSLTLKGAMAQGCDEEGKFFLFLPLTFMNCSGFAVREIKRRKNIALENILVVSDDLNLAFGQLRIRGKGSCGGHNGLESIKECLGTSDFARLKVGIGRPKKKEQTTDFVLSDFTKKEKKELDHYIAVASDCCKFWLDKGLTKSMNQFNRRKEDE